MTDHSLHRQNGSPLRVRCLACETWIDLRNDAEQWDLVDCPHCNTLHELTSLQPPTLNLIELGDDAEGDLIYEDDDFSIDDYDDDL